MSEMGQGLELEWLVLGLASRSGLGLVVELGPRPSEDGPLPAERIRRSWEAGKCAAMAPVVGLGLVVWPGRAVEPEPHRSEDGPLPAERIRRSWEAGKCAAMAPGVGLGRVVWRGGVVGPEPPRSEDRPLQGEPDPGAVRVWGRAGRGSRSCP